MFLVTDVGDLQGNDFVGEDDVPIGVENHLEAEGTAIELFGRLSGHGVARLQVNLFPFDNQSCACNYQVGIVST